MADTMVHFANDNLAQQFLTEEQIKKVCPLAYATAPTNDRVSDKYVLANTATVISDMEKLGWKVVEAKQRKAHQDGSGRFSYHMVAFQNPEIKITKTVNDGEEVVDCYPRIIVTNSHDGLNCFQLHCGLFRLVCSNGLIISDLTLVDFKIRHIYYEFEELRRLVANFIGALPAYVQSMTRMANVTLTEDQKQDFAKKALCIRKGISEEELEVDEDTLKDILLPQRKEDEGNSLWNVYNVLQEKITKGGYLEAKEGKKARKVRKVTSFIKDMDLSRQIDKVAKSYLPVAA